MDFYMLELEKEKLKRKIKYIMSSINYGVKKSTSLNYQENIWDVSRFYAELLSYSEESFITVIEFKDEIKKYNQKTNQNISYEQLLKECLVEEKFGRIYIPEGVLYFLQNWNKYANAIKKYKKEKTFDLCIFLRDFINNNSNILVNLYIRKDKFEEIYERYKNFYSNIIDRNKILSSIFYCQDNQDLYYFNFADFARGFHDSERLKIIAILFIDIINKDFNDERKVIKWLTIALRIGGLKAFVLDTEEYKAFYETVEKIIVKNFSFNITDSKFEIKKAILNSKECADRNFLVDIIFNNYDKLNYTDIVFQSSYLLFLVFKKNIDRINNLNFYNDESATQLLINSDYKYYFKKLEKSLLTNPKLAYLFLREMNPENHIDLFNLEIGLNAYCQFSDNFMRYYNFNWSENDKAFYWQVLNEVTLLFVDEFFVNRQFNLSDIYFFISHSLEIISLYSLGGSELLNFYFSWKSKIIDALKFKSPNIDVNSNELIACLDIIYVNPVGRINEKTKTYIKMSRFVFIKEFIDIIDIVDEKKSKELTAYFVDEYTKLFESDDIEFLALSKRDFEILISTDWIELLNILQKNNLLKKFLDVSLGVELNDDNFFCCSNKIFYHLFILSTIHKLVCTDNEFKNTIEIAILGLMQKFFIYNFSDGSSTNILDRDWNSKEKDLISGI